MVTAAACKCHVIGEWLLLISVCLVPGSLLPGCVDRSFHEEKTANTSPSPSPVTRELDPKKSEAAVSTNPTPNPSAPKFEVAAELREGHLLVTYSVLNPGPLAIYLLNRVPDVAMLTSPDLVYI